jgi:hypothetical protein
VVLGLSVQQIKNFLKLLRPNLERRGNERPEMISHGEQSRRPKQANPNQTKEQTMKLKTQIAVMVLALAASTSLVWSADRQAPRAVTPTLVGVWQVIRMGVNCDDPNQTRPPFPALMTFYRDGTLTAYANPPGTGPLDTPEAGLWQHEPGSQNYSFHDISYVYDENGAFAGSGVVTANVHLTSANSFEYSATIQFFDADGNLVFSGCGRATGTRFE